MNYQDGAQKKSGILWSILFFREDPDVVEEFDEQTWKRTRIYMYTTAILVAVWGVFDVFIDFKNLWVFLTLRAIYTPLTLLCAANFHRQFFRDKHRKWAIVHYLLLILDIGLMVLWTDSFVKYLIGFSTIFWGASVIMLWRFWHTMLPGLVVILVAFVRFSLFPHNVVSADLITGLYYFMTCLVFTGIISAYGYWNAYQLAEKNITLRKTHDKLLNAKKMASLNMVVASVAHEINTPVGTAITAASHAKEEFNNIIDAVNVGEISIDQITEPSKDGISSINSVLNELRRTADLVERLQETAVDQSSYERRYFNLRQYLEENIVHVGLRPILKQSNISIAITGEKNIALDSYPGEFSQVFTNLIMNSILHGYSGHKLSDKQGVITIKLIQADDLVTIYYSDDGKGMTSDVVTKIFDPFFTTRGTTSCSEGRGHRGSGLGMSIVYNIVTKKLHGKIDVRSQPDMGTLFVIDIPTSNKNEVVD